jgi:hypothetical protein
MEEKEKKEKILVKYTGHIYYILYYAVTIANLG